MFEQQIPEMPKPRFTRIGPYIISLDYVHGVMSCKTGNKEFPFQVYVTYTDKTSVALDMPNKEECDQACDKIANYLGAT